MTPTALPRYMHKPRLGARLNRGHPLARRLVARWLMNEGGGRAIRDLTGRNHGVITGADWFVSLHGHALDFSGADTDVVQCGNNLGTVTALSFSAMLYLPSAASGHQRFISKHDAASYGFVWGTDSSFKPFIGASNNGSDWAAATGDNALGKDQWLYLAATYSVDTDTVTFYKDGIQDGATKALVRTSINNSTAPLRLGRDPWTYNSFDGYMADARLYDRVLTAGEVQWLYCDPCADIQPLPIRTWANAPVVGVDFPELLPIMGVG